MRLNVVLVQAILAQDIFAQNPRAVQRNCNEIFHQDCPFLIFFSRLLGQKYFLTDFLPPVPNLHFFAPLSGEMPTPHTKGSKFIKGDSTNPFLSKMDNELLRLSENNTCLPSGLQAKAASSGGSSAQPKATPNAPGVHAVLAAAAARSPPRPSPSPVSIATPIEGTKREATHGLTTPDPNARVG